MRYEALPAEVFIENRKKFAAKMKPDSVALFVSNPEIPVSADAIYPFKQNPDFFYLTGIDQEQCALLIFPDAKNATHREILFLRKTNDHIKVWEGHKVDKEQGKALSGVEHIRWMDDLDQFMRNLSIEAKNIYLNTNEHGRMGADFTYGDLELVKKIRSQYPLHEFERSAPILHAIRSAKSTHEIAAIQKACNLTGQAFERVCRFIKPGVKEYEVEAEIIHEFISGAGNGHAYSPIIASGLNACILHYQDNNQPCMDGDLILMDFGANYGNYCADLTRTIPVNGRYTDRQKEVYNSVLKVMKEATAMLQPGVLLGEYEKEVGKITEAELVKLGLITHEDIKNQNPDYPAYKKYFMHGTSHHLGLDVHDVGSKSAPLLEGAVLTVEPGIYIPDEKIGVRIENDVVVTNGEPKDLMGHIPREIEEIEDLMNS